MEGDVARAPAGRDYLARFYPGLYLRGDDSTKTTYMIPPFFERNDPSPKPKEEPLASKKKDDVQSAMKGEDAEYVIFCLLREFGRETDQNMAVLTKVKVDIEDTNRELTDFVIIHKRIGVILIEVKAAEQCKQGRLSKAKRQLRIGEQFIKNSSSSAIPVYKVIAMPNANAPGGGNVQRAEYIYLFSENCNDNDFTNWWNTHFEKGKFSEDIDEITTKLLQKTAIVSTTKALAERFDQIDKQEFLFKRHEHGIQRSMRVKRFTFITPEQLSIWEGSYHQIFCGASGSGKTILLQHKALECLKNQEKVIIFVPCPLDSLYREFFNQNNCPLENCCIVSKQDDFLYKDVKECHIFVDEFQILCAGSSNMASPLVEVIGRKQGDGIFYRWICYDFHQIAPNSSLRGNIPRTYNARPNDSKGCIFSSLVVLIEQFGFEHARSLTTAMRNTVEIYECLKKYISKTSHLKASSQSLGDIRPLMLPPNHCHVGRQGSVGGRSLNHHCSDNVDAESQLVMDKSKGLEKRPTDFEHYWDYTISLGHQVSGPAVIEKTCNEVGDVFEVIRDELNKWARKGDTYDYLKVAVLVSRKKLRNDLRGYKSDIPMCNIGSGDSFLVVDLAENARSFEWSVVISVYSSEDEFYHNYVSFS